MDKKECNRAINRYRQRFLDERFKDMVISRGEAPFLNKILQGGGEILMNDLTDQLFFHKSHATRSINKLVEDGLITKTKNQEDLRSYVLKVTDKGKVVAEEVKKIFDDWDHLVDAVITDEEREMFKQVTLKIYHQLRKYYNEEDILDESSI